MNSLNGQLAHPARGAAADAAGNGWLTSLEIREKGRSPSLPANLDAMKSNQHWFKKVACCRVETTRGCGQGILVHLGERLTKALGVYENPSLALITSHRVIPSIKLEAKSLTLRIGPDSTKKHTFKFTKNDVACCKSCCGPDGICNQFDAHAQQSARNSCRVGWDFTILILKSDFANDILKKDLLIPPMVDLDMQSLDRALQSDHFYILQKNGKSGVIDRNEIHMRYNDAAQGGFSLERDVVRFRENCKLKYHLDHPECIVPESSGAGVFYWDHQKNILVLLGIHISHGAGEIGHNGIALHTIFHALAGKMKFFIICFVYKPFCALNF